MQKRDYYLAFSYAFGIGPKRLNGLLHAFGSESAIWDAPKEAIQNVIGMRIGAVFDEFRNTFSLEKTLETLEKKKIRYVTIVDKEYPALLRSTTKKKSVILVSPPMADASRISYRSNDRDSGQARMTKKETRGNYYPPFVLYVKGNIFLLNDPKTIGIVGTRKITDYGKQVTRMITQDLVQADFTIISGLALGVDAMAHNTTLQQNGKTIAVLGSGVDICSPRENQQIYNAILEKGGAIVSTFLPGMDATIGSFPARNAIIAGLSLGIVVTEGAADSGSLITASNAATLRRPVFAVPGPITSNLSKGANSLLQQGAIMATRGEDIIKVLKKRNVIASNSEAISTGIATSLAKGEIPRNDEMIPEEQEISYLLRSQSLHFDEIVRRIKKSAKETGSILSMMEVKGMVKSSGGIYEISYC